MNSFWLYILAISFLMPILILITGWLCKEHPPKKINNFYGYRTKRSKQCMDAWMDGHFYVGDMCIKLGYLWLALTIIVMACVMRSPSDVIASITGIIICIQVLSMILPIIFTEKYLNEICQELHE